MDVKILQDALSAVHPAVQRTSTLPVLQNVLLESADGKLTVSATDLELGIRVSIPGEGKKWSVTVPASSLRKLAGVLSGDDVVLQANKNGLVVKGKSRHTLPGISASEFPPFPEVDGQVQLDARTLRSLFGRVGHAVSTDYAHPILWGIETVGDGETLRMTALDGHRLATATAPSSAEYHGIIMSRGLRAATRIAQDGETISLGTNHNAVVLKGENWTVATQAVVGSFPKWEQIIPKESEITTTATVVTSSFAKAVREISIYGSPSLKVEVKDDLRIFVNWEEHSGEVSLEGEIQGEKGFVFWINPKYLADALGAVKTPKVTLKIKGPTFPIVLQDDESLTQVIMPIYVQE